MSEKILVVEDNLILSRVVEKAFYEEGYETHYAKDGKTAQDLLSKNHYDLILLDLILPLSSGEEVMKFAKKIGNMPVIVTTSKNAEEDKLAFFGLGIDDYVVKPYSIVELVARVQAVLRRYRAPYVFDTHKQLKKISLDYTNFEVKIGNKNIYLRKKEFMLLDLFVSNPNVVISKKNIYREIWKDDYINDDNLINVHIRRLREQIETDPSKPSIIRTIRGRGYILDDK